MAAPEAKPVTFTQIDAEDYDGPAAKPLLIVGEIPIEGLEQADAEVTPQEVEEFTAVPGSFADVAAVRTYLLTHLTELNAFKDALVAAGVLTEA